MHLAAATVRPFVVRLHDAHRSTRVDLVVPERARLSSMLFAVLDFRQRNHGPLRQLRAWGSLSAGLLFRCFLVERVAQQRHVMLCQRLCGHRCPCPSDHCHLLALLDGLAKRVALAPRGVPALDRLPQAVSSRDLKRYREVAWRVDPEWCATTSLLKPVGGNHQAPLRAPSTAPLHLVQRLGRRLRRGLAVHHAAVDGSASTQFLHAWAAAACAHTKSPVIDRRAESLLPGAFGLVPGHANHQQGHKVEFDMPAGQLLATFTLTRDDIHRVKDAVAAAPVHLTGRYPGLRLVVPPPSQRGHARRAPPHPRRARTATAGPAWSSSSTTVGG
ncbi:hypothetical protein HU200_033354 [Digitaria exilis]|uniref:Uncharacterized protein n=1 Tax=Digitaria exilis TaxID=1010633 RepID=A0A835EN92_9POAL|nr:hypothetical protein HU200_033354 [Digitaria exilis]